MHHYNVRESGPTFVTLAQSRTRGPGVSVSPCLCCARSSLSVDFGDVSFMGFTPPWSLSEHGLRATDAWRWLSAGCVGGAKVTIGGVYRWQIIMSDVVMLLYTQFCAILCVFSLFSEFWKLSVSGIMIKNKKNIHWVGKAHCILSFLSEGWNASEKIFEKMIGRYIKQIY